jgi:hypothetical protein
MYPRTAKTDKDAEFRRGPLRGWRAAVAAAVVLGGFLNLEELAFMLAWKEMGEREGGGTLDRVSGSTSHMALLAMLACVCFFLSHSWVSFLSL